MLTYTYLDRMDRKLFGIYKRGENELVDSSCVSGKIAREFGIHKYRRRNIFNEENFNPTLGYDDVEAGMDIE